MVTKRPGDAPLLRWSVTIALSTAVPFVVAQQDSMRAAQLAPPASIGPAQLSPQAVTALQRGGMTLFPGRVRRGELLRFVVDGATRAAPEPDASEVGVHARGDTVRADRETERNGVRWVVLADRSYVPAARVDRLPQLFSGNLTSGRERLTRGRIMPWSYRPSDLDTIPTRFKADGFEQRTISLRRGAATAFLRMLEAAERDGIVLRVFSGWRDADYQARLYAINLERRGPMQRVSAAPGRSEHQLGTAADVATPDVPILTPQFVDSPAGVWIMRRAAEFGIVATFSLERHEGRGVAFEPWHLRWVGVNVDRESEW